MKKMLQYGLCIWVVLLFGGCVGKHNIHDAAKEGDIAVIETFLNKGGNIELSPPKNPWTGAPIFNNNKLLHMAVQASQKNMIEFLLQNNANIEARNANGDTPLLLSAKYGLLDISRLLLKHNANIFAKNRAGQTVLHASIKEFRYDEPKIVKHLNYYLNQHASVNVQDNWQDTPVHLAARYDLVEVIKLLEKRGAKLDIKNRYQDTPISLSLKILFNQKEIRFSKAFEYLIEKKVNVKTKNNKNQTLLHRTCNPQYIKQLIQKGVSIHEKGQYKETAPFMALQKCPKQTLLTYLEYGFDVNTKSKDNEPVLFVAFKNSVHKKTIMSTLIEHKANIHQTNKHGETFLHKAARDSVSMIDLALEQGININAKTKQNATPLHTASSIRVYTSNGVDPTLSAYKYLVNQPNIDLNVQDNKGCTPLIRAVANGNYDKAHVLIDKGVKLNIKEKRGHTALDVAMLNRGPKKIPLIQRLQKEGAQGNILPSSKKRYSIICAYP
jgi:ankyrin repeat protein